MFDLKVSTLYLFTRMFIWFLREAKVFFALFCLNMCGIFAGSLSIELSPMET